MHFGGSINVQTIVYTVELGGREEQCTLQVRNSTARSDTPGLKCSFLTCQLYDLGQVTSTLLPQSSHIYNEVGAGT